MFEMRRSAGPAVTGDRVSKDNPLATKPGRCGTPTHHGDEGGQSSTHFREEGRLALANLRHNWASASGDNKIAGASRRGPP